MMRVRIAALFALVLLAAALPQAAAQQRSFKDAVVGAWLLKSVYDQYQDSRKVESFGANAAGIYVFGADGAYSQIIIGEPRGDMKSADPRRPDAFVVAFIGRYTVDEATHTISYKIERAGYSARNGMAASFAFTIDGETASIVGSPRSDQNGTYTPHVELRRFKP